MGLKRNPYSNQSLSDIATSESSLSSESSYNNNPFISAKIPIKQQNNHFIKNNSQRIENGKVVKLGKKSKLCYKIKFYFSSFSFL